MTSRPTYPENFIEIESAVFSKSKFSPLFYLVIMIHITAQAHRFLPASGYDSEELRYPSSTPASQHICRLPGSVVSGSQHLQACRNITKDGRAK